MYQTADIFPVSLKDTEVRNFSRAKKNLWMCYNQRQEIEEGSFFVIIAENRKLA